MMTKNIRGVYPLRILALMDTSRVSGPCLGLFELIEQIPEGGPQFLVGFFSRSSGPNSPACDEATRRSIPFVLLREKYRYDPSLFLQALQLVKKHNISLIQSHGYKAGALAWIIKRWTGLPWLAFVHGYTAENRRMALYNRLDRWLMRSADGVIAVSEATKILLQKAGLLECKISVIHNGIGAQRRSAGSDAERLRLDWNGESDTLLIGVIGRFSPEKGQAVFLDALKIVVRALPRSNAVLIGEGPERSALEATVRAAGLEKHVQFAGYQTDMSSVYGALDLVVIPSFSEGLPNVLLEAFLHGRAVVATAVGGIPEVMQGSLSTCLVSPGNAKALSDKILEVLQDSDLRVQIAETGKREVETNFSVYQRGQKMQKLYEECLHGRS